VEGELAGTLRAELSSRGGLFFRDLLRLTRGFGPDLEQTLWDLVFGGELTNDTFSPVRTRVGSLTRKTQIRASRFRSRRTEPPGTEGRWSLLPDLDVAGPSPTERSLSLARQLLERHGVLTREAVHAEGTPGGFAALYPVLKSMEEASKVRRGYFVEGLGATQFALLGAVERLREQRDPIEDETALVLAATDPAQPYGAALPWPSREGAKPQRSAGAQVVLLRGELLAYLGRSEKSLLSFLPAHEPERSHAARVLAETLVRLVSAGGRRALLIHQIDGAPPESSELAAQFERAGFSLQSRGLFARRASRSS
jgi:ATP-dependent Lhr-like helicase